MKLTTTLNLLKENKVCGERILKHLGKDYDCDKPINLLTILETDGIQHFFWAFRALQQDWSDVKPILLNIAIEMAESVLHIFEEEFPKNQKPRKTIEAAKYETDAEILKTKTLEAREVAICAYSREAAAKAAWAVWGAILLKEYMIIYDSYPWGKSEISNVARLSTSHGFGLISERLTSSKRLSEYNSTKLKQMEIIKKYVTWD